MYLNLPEQSKKKTKNMKSEGNAMNLCCIIKHSLKQLQCDVTVCSCMPLLSDYFCHIYVLHRLRSTGFERYCCIIIYVRWKIAQIKESELQPKGERLCRMSASGIILQWWNGRLWICKLYDSATFTAKWAKQNEHRAPHRKQNIEQNMNFHKPVQRVK